MSQPVTIKRGDRLPALTASVGFDLTGATVAFVLTPKARGAPAKVNAAPVVVSAPAGTVQYNWGATDTDTIGSTSASSSRPSRAASGATRKPATSTSR